jgi:hypothetical protein
MYPVGTHVRAGSLPCVLSTVGRATNLSSHGRLPVLNAKVTVTVLSVLVGCIMMSDGDHRAPYATRMPIMIRKHRGAPRRALRISGLHWQLATRLRGGYGAFGLTDLAEKES